MTIQLDAVLEAAIKVEAEKTGTAPESLAVAALKERFQTPRTPADHEEWLRRLRAAAIPAGVSLPNEAFLGEALYD